MDSISAERLGIRGWGAWRVRGIDIRVRPGERVSLLGPPGSGKSSLIRAFAGLLAPTEGGIRLMGEPALRARRRVALLPESGAVDPALTPTEHLEFVAQARGVARSTRMGEAMHLLSRLHLTDVRDVPARRLSGGQRRAIAVACALMPPALVLLLDEPFAGMDPAVRLSVDDLLRDRQSQNKVAVIIATRQPQDTAGADRVALLREGRLLVCDTPVALCNVVGPDTIIVRPRDDSLSARRLEDALGVKVFREADGYRLVVERGEAALEELMRGFASGIRAVYVRQASMEQVYLRYFGDASRLDE